VPSWLRLSCAAGLAGLALVLPRAARADDAPPSVQQIRSAAIEYDAGRRAFVDKDYDGAAAHFENAFHDAPSAEAIRNAIRARRRAGQLARAATLAELASQNYPKDAPTGVVVRETLAESSSKLHKITLLCTPECGAAADGRAISVSDATQTVFFLEPGSHDLVVSWSGDRTRSQKFLARAGGHDELSLEAPPMQIPPPAVVAPAPVVVPQTVGQPPADAVVPEKTRPLPPWVFLTGAALTAGGAAFTIWSGIDAENNPGPDAVKTMCTGKGPSCPAYQSGLSAQLRTNVAIGVTGGVALGTTIVGVFFTQWSKPKPKTAALGLEPSFDVSPHGGGFSFGGSF
jgi:hypothetical protein